jgi:hypothetical protein
MIEYAYPEVLIETGELEGRLKDPALAVVEVDEDATAYDMGHLPGAVANLEMVKISMEARSGAATFGVAVQAESIERALSLVQQRYPKGEARVKFPWTPRVSS